MASDRSENQRRKARQPRWAQWVSDAVDKVLDAISVPTPQLKAIPIPVDTRRPR
jgi:hypothetical protein